VLRILIIDSEADRRLARERLIMDAGYRTALAESGEAALQAVRLNPPDLVVLDLDLPGMSGVEVLRAMRLEQPRLQVIVVAGQASAESAIETIKVGAFDFLLEPFHQSEMLAMIQQAQEVHRFLKQPVEFDEAARHGDGDVLIGRSRAMQEVYRAIGRVATTEATVLIRGESGTGKELVARAVYQHSERADRPFVVVNCVAIPEALLESELFGYEKGAFTGATSRRTGKIQRGHGGTVFLDEIGDMPLSVQAKFLRLLQEKSIERIGGSHPISVDVRVIAATNRNLEAAISEGRFREDLFYRLNVVPIVLPPLRDRRDDIPLLAEYFLGRFARELGVRCPGIEEEAHALLAAHGWPGNVRELANAMEQCLIFGRGRPIGPEDVAALVMGREARPGHSSGAPDQAMRSWALAEMAQSRDKLLSFMSDHLAALVIAEALRLTRGNRTRAAAILGLSRPALLARMDKYDLS
jgi:DNA-binding NtrC family response regulator